LRDFYERNISDLYHISFIKIELQETKVSYLKAYKTNDLFLKQ